MSFKKNIFIPFVVLGDPTLEKSKEIIQTLIKNGAGALELGFAFSDPIADGPVIQESNKRALSNGITTEKSFSLIADIRSESTIPISLMVSFGLVFRYGVENFYQKCKELSVDAVLFPDIPLEEADEVISYSKKYGIAQVFLVSPTTISRVKEISKVCSGYVYLVSLVGTTGVRENLSNVLPSLIKKVKAEINLPVYVGFGISKPDHVREVLSAGADGAICGSAICKIIQKKEFTVEELGEFCKSMYAATK